MKTTEEKQKIAIAMESYHLECLVEDLAAIALLVPQFQLQIKPKNTDLDYLLKSKESMDNFTVNPVIPIA